MDELDAAVGIFYRNLSWFDDDFKLDANFAVALAGPLERFRFGLGSHFFPFEWASRSTPTCLVMSLSRVVAEI